MVEYVMLNASAAKQLVINWTSHVDMRTVLVVGALAVLAWLTWRAFVVRR